MTIERGASLALLTDALEPMLADCTQDSTALAESLPSRLHHDALDVLVYVNHFLADADIRARDHEYREMQEAHMRGLIDALRRDAPITCML